MGGKLLRHVASGPATFPIEREKDDPLAMSICQYHVSCLEALLGPSIEALGLPPRSLMKSRKCRTGSYLCKSSGVYVLYSPQRIILGGGVMNTTQLFPYSPKLLENLTVISIQPNLVRLIHMFVSDGCGGNQGILGCACFGCGAWIVRVQAVQWVAYIYPISGCIRKVEWVSKREVYAGNSYS